MALSLLFHSYPRIVITALVAVIHRGASGVFNSRRALVEPWIAGTSPAMTNYNIVITARVAVIHRGASGVFNSRRALVEPWIAGTSSAMTNYDICHHRTRCGDPW